MRLLVPALLAPLAGRFHATCVSNADGHGGPVNLVTDLTHDGAVANARDHCAKDKLAAVIVSNNMTFVCQRPPE